MSLVKYIARLQRMDLLIAMRATGSPDEFAIGMNLGKSTIVEILPKVREYRFYGNISIRSLILSC